MQISYNTNSSFPSQVVPDAEKATLEYGLAVGRAIEGEWFRNYRGGAMVVVVTLLIIIITTI